VLADAPIHQPQGGLVVTIHIDAAKLVDAQPFFKEGARMGEALRHQREREIILRQGFNRLAAGERQARRGVDLGDLLLREFVDPVGAFGHIRAAPIRRAIDDCAHGPNLPEADGAVAAVLTLFNVPACVT
jgi:hypothetical protein